MPNDTQPTEEQLRQAVKESLRVLYERDQQLMNRPWHGCEIKDVSEPCIVFRFGVYFQKFIDTHQWFQNYNIDVEYNRNMDDPKCTSPDERGKYPDFIVHKREQNSDNLLILEFKTYDNKYKNGGVISDYRKIRKFMQTDIGYQYRYGASIIIEQEPSPAWCWMVGDDFRERSGVRCQSPCAEPPYSLFPCTTCTLSSKERTDCRIYRPVWE